MSITNQIQSESNGYLLRSCPFCGSVALFEENSRWISCQNSDCGAFLNGPENTRQSSAAAWNRRQTNNKGEKKNIMKVKYKGHTAGIRQVGGRERWYWRLESREGITLSLDNHDTVKETKESFKRFVDEMETRGE